MAVKDREKNKKQHTRLGEGSASYDAQAQESFSGIDKLSGISLNDIYNDYDMDDLFDDERSKKGLIGDASEFFSDEVCEAPNGDVWDGASAGKTGSADGEHEGDTDTIAAARTDSDDEYSAQDGERSFFDEIFLIVSDFGLRTSYWTKRISRNIFRVIVKPFKLFAALIRIFFIAVDRYIFGAFRRFGSESANFMRDIRSAGRNLRAAFRQDRFAAFSVLGHYIAKGFLRHRQLLASFVYTALPLGMALIFVVRVSAVSKVTSALEVIYNGDSIGYIMDESVFVAAAADANDRLSAGRGVSDKPLISEPVYKLSMVSIDKLSYEDTICDRLIENSVSNITNACGIYIGGAFLCAVKNESDAKTVFNTIVASYKSADDENVVSYGFTKDVEYTQGLYPDDEKIIWDASSLAAYLDDGMDGNALHIAGPGETIKDIAERFGVEEAKFAELNPGITDIQAGNGVIMPEGAKLIEVQVVKSERYYESVEYETIERDNSSRFKGDDEVITEGVEGKDMVTELVTYVNGEQVFSEELSRVRVLEPVSEVIEIGTKSTQITSSSGASYSVSVSSRGWVWPCPNCHTVSSYFGGRSSGYHSGIDITSSGAEGKIVVAAKDGRVESVVRSGSGLGNYVVINHGDGVKTRYGHCQSGSIIVYEGQWVSAGQQIGRVGETGNATGPHLHFEVLINGSAVNPLNYIS